MAQFNFSLGSLNLINPNVSPAQALQVGLLRDVGFDVSFDTKRLTGANSFPVDVARGEGKITGKMKVAQIFADTFSSVLNSTKAAGTTIGVFNEQRTGAASVVASPGGSALNGTTKVFVDDLGVFSVSDGKWLARAAAAAAGVSYSVSGATGIYVFAGSDIGKTFYLNYSYSDSTTGYTNTLSNGLMGASTVYQLTVFNTFRSKPFGIKLFAVTVPKLSLGIKMGDYMDQDLDFEGFADATTQKVLELYTAE